MGAIRSRQASARAFSCAVDRRTPSFLLVEPACVKGLRFILVRPHPVSVGNEAGSRLGCRPFFTWLVTLALHESPDKVGLAQFTMMLPTLALILGGVAADGWRCPLGHLGPEPVSLPVLGLLTPLAQDALSYSGVLVYALAMGVVQAFLTRLGMGCWRSSLGIGFSALQRLPWCSSGFSLAWWPGSLMPWAPSGCSACKGSLALGPCALGHCTGACPRCRPRPTVPSPYPGASVGIRTVLVVPAPRTVVLMNLAVGLFAGSFQVGIPLLVRMLQRRGRELAALNAVHVVGAVVTMVSLPRYGDVPVPGAASIRGAPGRGGLSAWDWRPALPGAVF